MSSNNTNFLSRDPRWIYQYHRLRRELSNFSLIKSRHVDGQIVSQHQSGTHWLKYMMANALAAHYDLPPPRCNHANDFIGGPKDLISHPDLPRLISSHSIPPIGTALLLSSGLFQLPPYILLLRDIRESLVSNYRKWESRYAVPFSEFLRGDLSGKRFNSDIWWSLRFLNAWGDLLERRPQQIICVHYRSLVNDARGELERIFSHLEIDISSSAIARGVAAGSKEEMMEKRDPSRPLGEVQVQQTNSHDLFSLDDRDFFSRRCEQFLRHNFDYDYSRWSN